MLSPFEFLKNVDGDEHCIFKQPFLLSPFLVYD